MSVEYYTNNLDALADDTALEQMRRQLLSDALDQNEFNTKKRRNEYIGTVISNRQEADFPQKAAKGSTIAVKVRLNEAQDEFLPDFCTTGYTKKQKLILESCHGTAISRSPLSMKNGEKVPRFGDRIACHYSKESPDFYGRMRDLRYDYPTATTQGKIVCPPATPLPNRRAQLLGDKIEISDKIEFVFNKWDIKKSSYGLLNDVAAILKENPHIEIKIEGHTDSRGSAEYNKKLSENRAESVYEYLRKAGVPFKQMPETIGWGEEKPYDPLCAEGSDHMKSYPRGHKEREYCHQKNRRVEFNIIGGPQRGKKLTTKAKSSKPPPTAPATGILKDKKEVKKKKEEGKSDTPTPEEPKKSEPKVKKEKEKTTPPPPAKPKKKPKEPTQKNTKSEKNISDAWVQYYKKKTKATKKNPKISGIWKKKLAEELEFQNSLEDPMIIRQPDHRPNSYKNSYPPPEYTLKNTDR